MTKRSLVRSAVVSSAVAAAALAMTGLLVIPAEAVSSKVRSLCKDDYLRFCPSYEPDSKQARQCMRQVGKRLSPRCIEALADAGEIRRRKR